jgi:hypothetical protein
MGIRGPKPKPNARRRGVRVAISPTHADICDRIKVGTQSRADVVELALEHFEQFLEQLGTIPPHKTE